MTGVQTCALPIWQRLVVAPFALLEVEFEISLHAIKLCQTAFCKAPKGLNTIDMNRFFRKVFGFVDTKMFVEPNVHQSVVALPAVGVDNAFRGNLAPDDGLERLGRAISDQFSANRAVTLIDAENRLLERAPAPFAGAGASANPAGAKKLSSTSTTPSICSFCDTW